MTPDPRHRHTPWWFTLLILLALVPAFSTPWLLAAAPESAHTTRLYVTLYPVVALASAFYSWVSWGVRTLLAWIMLIFLVLIDLSVFYLALCS